MSAGRGLRAWSAVHTWASVACTLFLFVLCLTGLPLVFSDDIEQAFADAPQPAAPASRGQRPDLDEIVQAARRQHPGEKVSSLGIDADADVVTVWLGPSTAPVRVAAADARVLPDAAHADGRATRVLDAVRTLHVELFAGLPGALFLAAMALAFLLAIVSGAVLYAPYARRQPFGTVRRDRAPRVRWLDLHNLYGVALLAWTLVIGATGLLNELATPLFSWWTRGDVAAILQPWQGAPPPPESAFAPVSAAVAAARAATGAQVSGVLFPGHPQGSAHHFVVWTHGTSALTRHLFTPVLVDARSGAVVRVIGMPWYLRALETSRPLHYGDYGGLPLKFAWALLDVLTLVVLASGVHLWLGRRRRVVA